MQRSEMQADSYSAAGHNATPLFNHLISTCQECRRDRELQRLRSLEIDDKLELCRLFDRELSRPRAFEDAVGKVGEPPIGLNEMWAVRADCPALRKDRPAGDDRRAMTHAEIDNPLPILYGKPIGEERYRFRRFRCHSLEGGGQFVAGARGKILSCDAQS